MQEQRIPRSGPLRVTATETGTTRRDTTAGGSPEPSVSAQTVAPTATAPQAAPSAKRSTVEGIEQIARDGPFIYIAMRRDIDYDVTIKAIKEALGYEEPK